MVSPELKTRFNTGETDNLYYFRDNIGNEVDVVCYYGYKVNQIEIKSGQTISSDFFKGLNYFSALNKDISQSYLIYGGVETYIREGVRITSWRDIGSIVDSAALQEGVKKSRVVRRS